VTFKGPGGHSFGAFGLANPMGAMGRAIAKIQEMQVPKQPKTTFNVGRVGGGTSVNSIPFESWMEVDMRSSDPAALFSDCTAGIRRHFRLAAISPGREATSLWCGGPRACTPSRSSADLSAPLRVCPAVSRVATADRECGPGGLRRQRPRLRPVVRADQAHAARPALLQPVEERCRIARAGGMYTQEVYIFRRPRMACAAS